MRVVLRFTEVFRLFDVAPRYEVEVDRPSLSLREVVSLAEAQDANITRALHLSDREGSEQPRPAAVFLKDGMPLSMDTEITGDTEISVILPVAGG